MSSIRLIRRNRMVVPWMESKIESACRRAFKSMREDGEFSVEIARSVTERVRGNNRAFVHIEEVQDMVQEELMRHGHYKVAESYILYRTERSRLREETALHPREHFEQRDALITVRTKEGENILWDGSELKQRIQFARIGLDLCMDSLQIERELRRSLGTEISEEDLKNTIILNAKSLIEKDSDFSKFAARILLSYIYEEVLDWKIVRDGIEGIKEAHQRAFKSFIRRSVQIERLSEKLMHYHLDSLIHALDTSADLDFDYLGIQTLYDRYLIVDKTKKTPQRLETPQFFWMRVAMGIFINEPNDRENFVIRLYNLYKSRRFCSSTPTLFNSGTRHSQLSSCYLYKVDDSIESIMQRGIADNAYLSKWAGGLGGSWTAVRGTGSYIQGTNGESQGVIPFLKMHNDLLVAVNQGGRRRGSGCAYLETWHNDIEDFFQLRRNTGDDRRRTHDLNTANWIPDLFMKRMEARQHWTLFRSHEVPDLHELYGKKFEERYLHYEKQAEEDKIFRKKVPAIEIWKQMLKMLLETGHPWITFKDPCNVRSPQDHAGVIHSSNLCCMTGDQRVVTDKGILTVGELYKLGCSNKVLGIDGVYYTSKMLLPRPNAPIVKINTKEGYSHKVTPDHKVWVKDTGWVEAKDLKIGDRILIQQFEGMWGNKHFPYLAYIMGVVTGDGTISNNSVHIDIWSDRFKLRNSIERIVLRILKNNLILNTSSSNNPVFNRIGVMSRLTSAPLYRTFKEHGFNVDHKTSVPKFIWKSDRETVSSYLKGLYQTDGNICSSKSVTTLCLSSIDLYFLKEIQILWANFGVKTSINKMRGTSSNLLPDGKGGKKEYLCKPLYRLLITSVNGCKIAEEVTKFAKNKNTNSSKMYLSNILKKGYTQKLYSHFSGLEEVGNEDAYCLNVYSENHAWTVNGLITKNTEITLNTSDEETAVCNLGSIILDTHIREDGSLDHQMLMETISVAVRALDNVIDINFYPTEAARRSNMQHRPIGLGVMGLQNALFKKNLSFASQECVEFNDEFMEAVAFYAYSASNDLACERGAYASFKGSKWDRGLLPQDTLDLLEEERGLTIKVPRGGRMDWTPLREKIKNFGMRNSNVLAIAPTATISNIMGTTPCIEPNYKNLYVKENLGGKFTILDVELVRELKREGLWNDQMIDQLKYFEGELKDIPGIPDYIRHKHLTVFQIDYTFIIDAAARRQKWIDQSQSVNLFLGVPDLKLLSHIYRYAWHAGLKTTYYLRSLGASSIEASTVSVQKEIRGTMGKDTTEKFELHKNLSCSLQAALNGEECESCQ